MRLEDEVTLSITLTNSGSSDATLRGDIITFEEDCLVMICPTEYAHFNYYRGNKKISFTTNAGETGFNYINPIYNASNVASAWALTEIGIIPLICPNGNNNASSYALIVPAKAGDRIETDPWVVKNTSTTVKLKYKPITLY